MTAGAETDPADLGLAEPGPDAALRRTVSALESLGWTPDPAETGEAETGEAETGEEGQDSG
jgi:hypothetical protein